MTNMQEPLYYSHHYPPKKNCPLEEPGELFVVRLSFRHRWMDTERYVVPLSHDEVRYSLWSQGGPLFMEGHRNGKVLTTLNLPTAKI